MFDPRAPTFDKDQVLNFLLYHQTQEMRQLLKRELPGPYARVTGAGPYTVVTTDEFVAMKDLVDEHWLAVAALRPHVDEVA